MLYSSCQMFTTTEQSYEPSTNMRAEFPKLEQIDSSIVEKTKFETASQETAMTEVCCSYHQWAISFQSMNAYGIHATEKSVYLTTEAFHIGSLTIGKLSTQLDGLAGLVVKLSNSGQPNWIAKAQSKKGLTNGIELSQIISDLSEQSVYVVGSTRGIDVRFGKHSVKAKSNGHQHDSDAILAGLSTSNGFFSWGLIAGGDFTEQDKINIQSNDVAYDAVIDTDGFLYVSGTYEEPSKFGATSLVGKGSFLSKISSSGAFIWTRSTPSTLIGKTLGIDSQNRIVQASLFNKEIKLGSFTSQGPSNIIAIVTWSQGGKIQRVLTIRAQTKESSLLKPQIIVHPSGRITLVGELKGRIQFGTQIIESNKQTVYIARIDKNGSFQWVHKLGFSVRYTHFLSVDATLTDVFLALTNYREQMIDLSVCKYVGKQEQELLLLRIDERGTCVWVRAVPSAKHANISLTPNGDFLYVIGTHTSPIRLGEQSLYPNLKTKRNAFLWKISTRQ